MTDGRTKSAKGTIVVVQEQAFRLLTADGRALHLTLGVYGWPFPQHLARLRDAGTAVEVEYDGEPGTTTATARVIRAV